MFKEMEGIQAKETSGKNPKDVKPLWIVGAAIVASLLCLLPFIKWIYVPMGQELMESVGNSSFLPEKGYSTWTILDFVQKSNQGSIGLYGMILTVFGIAMTIFDLRFVYVFARQHNNAEKKLDLYGKAVTACTFGVVTAAVAIGYVYFSNSRFEQTAFVASPVLYLLILINIVGYIVAKQLQTKERARVHDHGFLQEVKKNWVLFLMLVPTFIYFLINCYLPMLGVYFAFTNFNFRDGLWASPFVGWKNFEFLFRGDLLRLVKNTVGYNVVFIVLGNILQIVFAIFVSQVAAKKYKKITQTLIFMPYFVSFVILKVLVYNMFEYDFGLINTILTKFGANRIDFYNSPSYWPFLITFFHIWKGLGYGMVIYLATITGIDRELYEAAKVDGANVFAQIRYVTLPLLKPTFIILLLYALGGIMKGQFELFYQMVGNNGVLYATTDILDTYVYRITTTQPLNMGIGTAAGLFQSVFGLALVIGTNMIIKRKNSEYALF